MTESNPNAANQNALFNDNIEDDTFVVISYNKTPAPNQSNKSYEEKIKELEEQALKSTEQSLNYLYESEEIGISTAIELDKQREQLENTNSNLDEMNVKLSETQKNINGMKSVFGAIKKSIFTSNSKVEKSPDTKRKSKSKKLHLPLFKSRNKNQDVRLRSLENDSIDNKKTNSSTTDPFEERLENNLIEIRSSMSRLKDLALRMNDEIKSQNDLLGDMNNKVVNLDLDIKHQNKQIDRLLGKK